MWKNSHLFATTFTQTISFVALSSYLWASFNYLDQLCDEAKQTWGSVCCAWKNPELSPTMWLLHRCRHNTKNKTVEQVLHLILLFIGFFFHSVLIKVWQHSTLDQETEKAGIFHQYSVLNWEPFSDLKLPYYPHFQMFIFHLGHQWSRLAWLIIPKTLRISGNLHT